MCRDIDQVDLKNQTNSNIYVFKSVLILWLSSMHDDKMTNITYIYKYYINIKITRNKVQGSRNTCVSSI